MSLRKKQSKFVWMVMGLLAWGKENGYEFTFAEAYRTPAQAKLNSKAGVGIVNSLHCSRLAIDLNVFKDGVWLKQTEDLTPLGEYWETLGGAWGGRFKRRDGNHFSLAHNGRK
mgnify:CR=1 FL=1|jgi:hypothetical protein